MKNYNMKLAIRALMLARSKGITWKLLLQIILDRPSAIVNAWNRIDKRPDICPAKATIRTGNRKFYVVQYQCSECKTFVSVVGTDGRCGRCNPSANF